MISTLSESKRPIIPIPAAAKYNASGQPIPPAPTTATFVFTIFTCPSYANYLRSICLEYLCISSVFNGYLILVFKGGDTLISIFLHF